jgi:putative glycerol-1-phosphate prenyltransferase
MLIESGTETAVQRVSKTAPLGRNNLDLALATKQEMLGVN